MPEIIQQLIAFQIRHKGTLSACIGQHDKFESIDFEMVDYEEFISSAKIRNQFSSTASPGNTRQSPSMSKKALGGKKGKNAERTVVLSESMLPAPLNLSQGLGMTMEVARFIENGDVFANMQDLFKFANSNNVMSGQTALRAYVESSQSGQLQAQQFNQMNNMAAQQGNPQMNFSPGANGFPQAHNFNMRAPGMNNQFASPGNPGHLGLPNAQMNNSPHMRQGGSPGQPGLPPHMQNTPMAVQMAQQQSTQGTNSSGPSANASPNAAANKKRRASQANGQNDPGGVQINGVVGKEKQTPKMNQKRQRPG